jgi:hypothetical protein
MPCAFGWVLAVSGLAAWLGRRWPEYVAMPVALCALVAVAAWVVVPNTASSAPGATPKREAVAALRDLPLGPGPIFEAGGFAALAGYDSPTISAWDKDEPFFALLDRHQIRIVILWERYLSNASLVDDPDVTAFLAEPSRYGFDPVYALPGFLRVFAAGRGEGRATKPQGRQE